MAFRNQAYNAGDKVKFLGWYHRYWNDRAAKVVNPAFDEYSGFILDLKKGDAAAVEYFRKRIAPLLRDKPIILTCVPSSNAVKLHTGIRAVTRALASDGRVDGNGHLRRITSLQEAKAGGPRSVALHKQTIIVDAPEAIAGREILLIDDVMSTGASMNACKQLLLEAGAAIVHRLALGKLADDPR